MLIIFSWSITVSFNPRPHTRGDRGVCRNHASVQGFNPRPHTRGDTPKVAKQLVRAVSIHAPTRGATSSVRAVNGKCVVSIHAPARGATESASPLPTEKEVSIHAPAGGRPPKVAKQFVTSVSIHAPARGATLGIATGSRQPIGFNPRPRAGGDYQTRV